MTEEEKQPVRFQLPDRVVELIPWAYALFEITEGMNPSKTELATINSILGQIENRIDYWLGEDLAGSVSTTDPSGSTVGDDANIFEKLHSVIAEHSIRLQNIANKLDLLEIKTGSGGHGFVDYTHGETYKRNQAVVDTVTETAYRVIADEYVADTVQNDCANGYLKLLGFESQIVSYGHDPSQEEVNTIPDDAVVVVYSPDDTPYIPET